MNRDIEDIDEVTINRKRYVRLDGNSIVDATVDFPMHIRTGDDSYKMAVVFNDIRAVDRHSHGEELGAIFKPGQRVRLMLVDKEDK